jgi:hypothetical protein
MTEEFLSWRLVLNKQMKNHGYSGNYDMVMNFTQAVLEGRNLEACLNEQRAKETKNKTRKAKEKESTLRSKFMIVQFSN